MLTREQIIGEIQRMAGRLGAPPGRRSFEDETGIRTADWYGVHWRNWGEALTEAGFQPNEKQGRLSSDHVLRKYAEAIRALGRVPTNADIRMYSRGRPDFPGHTTFKNHFGSKAGLLIALREWIGRNDEFADLLDLLPTITEIDSEKSVAQTAEGYVYLLKSGAYYKIGRSDQIERRVKQISIALPENVSLAHTIRTDDPPGIEAYWHRRFADRRANGEWFRLTAADVRAFKRRKFM